MLTNYHLFCLSKLNEDILARWCALVGNKGLIEDIGGREMMQTHGKSDDILEKFYKTLKLLAQHIVNNI